MRLGARIETFRLSIRSPAPYTIRMTRIGNPATAEQPRTPNAEESVIQESRRTIRGKHKCVAEVVTDRKRISEAVSRMILIHKKPPAITPPMVSSYLGTTLTVGTKMIRG